MRLTRTPILLAWCTAILLLVVGTTMPGSAKAEIEGHLWREWPWSASAHFVLFAFITGAPVYGSGRAWPLRALGLAIVLALVTEWLQSFVPGRHPMLRDGLIDMAGAITGVVASIVWGSRPPRTQDCARRT